MKERYFHKNQRAKIANVVIKMFKTSLIKKILLSNTLGAAMKGGQIVFSAVGQI